MKVFLGVDGGGTGTRAVLANDKGELLGLGIGGPANPKAVTIQAATASVAEAIQRAWRNAGMDQRPVDAAFMGIAGLRTKNDQQAFREALASYDLSFDEATEFSHDLSIALSGGLACEPGIVLVCGTGSACYGEGHNAETGRSGGWGWFIDDPGSGYWLGFQAMRAAARSSDGREGPTALVDAVQKFCRIKHMNDLPNIIYNPYFSRERIAELSPVVFEVAAAGDKKAHQILKEGFDELALMVAAVAKKVNLEINNLPITVTGGVPRNGEIFWYGLSEAIADTLPGARLIRPKYEPVIGALLLCLKEQGIRLEESVLLELSAAIDRASSPV